MAAPVTENARKPRMIQSAVLMVQYPSSDQRTPVKSPARVPSTDDMPRDTFRLSAARPLGGGLARAVFCPSEFLRGNPVHIACRRNLAPCRSGNYERARSARNPA